MEVIATKQGFCGRVIREAGDIFEMAEGAVGSWFKPTADKKPKGADKPGKDDAKTDPVRT